MKKPIALALVLVMAFSLAGCCCCIPMEKCELCGASKADNEIEVGGITYKVCDNCYSRYNFAYDFDAYEFNEESYGEYNSDDGSITGGNNCRDCGESIKEGQLYCHGCIRFGVCQGCGKSIDDNLLYCESCLQN